MLSHRNTKHPSRLRAALKSVLAVCLLAATVTVSQAQAETRAADTPNTLTACPQHAQTNAGFTDLDNYPVFEYDINCLAAYQITRGTGDGTTYTPWQPVSRFEMAAFMARTLQLIDIANGDMTRVVVYDHTISDIDGYANWIQADVNKVVALNIMGLDGDRFHPAADMTRIDMVRALTRVLVLTGNSVVTGMLTGDLLLDDWFQDVRCCYPAASDRAASTAYELGITRGTGVNVNPDAGSRIGDFQPDESVTRGAMAAFIVRTLAHSNVRPAGVTVQIETFPEDRYVQVSVRGQDFRPIPNQIVDVALVSADASDPCDLLASTVLAGSDACRIDTSDPATGSDGNVILALPEESITQPVNLKVFVGEPGERHDGNTLTISVAPREKPAEGVTLKVISNGASHIVRYGTEVDFRVTVQSAEDQPVADTRGWDIALRDARYRGDTLETINHKSLEFSDGRAEFSIIAYDPNPFDDNQTRIRLSLTGITPKGERLNNKVSFYMVDGDGGDPTLRGGNVELLYDDDPAHLEKLTVETRWFQDPGDNRIATAGVQVNAYNQYGTAVSGAPLRFWVTSPDDTPSSESDVPATTRFTDSDGAHRFTYSHSGLGEGHYQQTHVSYGQISCDDAPTGEPCGDLHRTATGIVYWSHAPDVFTGTAQVMWAETESNIMFVDPVLVTSTGSVEAGWITPTLLEYGENDHYVVNDAPVTRAAFEKALNAFDDITDAVITVNYTKTDLSRFALD